MLNKYMSGQVNPLEGFDISVQSIGEKRRQSHAYTRLHDGFFFFFIFTIEGLLYLLRLMEDSGNVLDEDRNILIRYREPFASLIWRPLLFPYLLPPV